MKETRVFFLACLVFSGCPAKTRPSADVESSKPTDERVPKSLRASMSKEARVAYHKARERRTRCIRYASRDIAGCLPAQRARTHIETGRQAKEAKLQKGQVFIEAACLAKKSCYEPLWARIRAARQVTGLVLVVEKGAEQGLRALGTAWREAAREEKRQGQHLTRLALCGAERRSQLTALGALPDTITYLSLDIGTAQSGFRALRGLESVEHLSILDSGFKDEDVATLKRFPALKGVVVSDAQLSMRGALRLAALPRIQYLNLQGNPLDRGIGPRLQRVHATTLKHLLIWNTLAGESFCSLLRARNLSRLYWPAFSRCPAATRVLGPRCIQMIGDMPKIESLSLGDHVLRDADLSLWRGLKKLRRLSAPDTSLGDRGLSEIARLPKLEILNIENNTWDDRKTNHFTTAGMRALSTAPALRMLNVNNLGLRDADVRMLAKIKTLEVLTLSGNPKISYRGMRALRRLPKLRRLAPPVRFYKSYKRILRGVGELTVRDGRELE